MKACITSRASFQWNKSFVRSQRNLFTTSVAGCYFQQQSFFCDVLRIHNISNWGICVKKIICACILVDKKKQASRAARVAVHCIELYGVISDRQRHKLGC